MIRAEEQVVIVDRHNQIIGAASRSRMRRECLIHRAVYIVVHNRKGQILVQQRSSGKDLYPGCFEIAVSGVVETDESYEQCAFREMGEELGVTDISLHSHTEFYSESKSNRVWGKIFTCEHPGPFTLQCEEVQAVFFIEPAQLETLFLKESLTPESSLLLSWLKTNESRAL